MPTPPDTIKAPVDVDDDTVVLVIETAPLEVNPLKVPTDVIFVCTAVCNIPVIVVAFEAPIEVTPSKVVIFG